MPDSFLPPAVLDMIVNAAEWTAGLDEAMEPLEGLKALMGEVSGASADMADVMGGSADAIDAAWSAASEAAARVLELEQQVAEASAEAADAQYALASASRESTAAGSQYAEALNAASESTIRLLGLQAQLAGAEADAAAAADAAVASVAALGDAQAGAAAAAGAAGDAEDAAAAKATAAGDAAGASGSKWKLWGLAVAAGVAISVKMAGDYQQSMTRLVTSAGESQKNLGLVSQGILAMSSATNTSTSQLASGMYTVESAGFHGAAGLAVLKAAAEGAQAEGADLATVANAVTSGLNAYGMKASQATSFTNQMLAVVGQGKMTMQDLASSMAAVLPTAAKYGLSFAQVGGALATMTSMGVSARQGSDDLANTIRNLGNPTSVATNEMAEFGISSTTVSQKLGKLGLTGTISYLSDAITSKMGKSGLVIVNAMNQSKSAAADAQSMLKLLPPSVQSVSKAYLDGGASYTTWYNATKNLPLTAKTMADQFATVAGKAHGFNTLLASGSPAAQTYSAALARMLGGATGLNVGLMLTGTHAKTFSGNVKAISEAARHAGSDVNGWGLIQKNFNFQLGSAEKAVQAMAISFGTALLPAATKAMKMLAEFGGWLTKHTAASKALAIAVGVLLAGALEHGLVKALKTCLSGFKDVLGAGKGVLGFFKAGEGEASGFSKMLSGIGTGGKAAWSGLQAAGSAISGVFSAAGSGIGSAVTAVKNWSIWSKIAAAATKAWSGIQAAFNVVMDANPIILVAIAVGLLIAGVVLAYIHFKAFRDVVNDVGRAIKDGFLDALHAVEKAIGDVVSFVRSHWELLVSIIGGPIAAIVILITAHWNTVKHVFDEAWGFIKNLVRRDVHEVETILSWFGSLPGKMRDWWNEAVSAVEKTVSRLLGDVREIPGRILAGLGDFGNLLWGAGADLIKGLIGGIESMAAAPLHAIEGIGHGIIGAAKDIFEWASPSKVFYRLGSDITAGLALGIGETKAQAVEESRRLGQEVAQAAASGQITASEAAQLGSRIANALASAERQLTARAAATAKAGKEIGLKMQAGILSAIEDATTASQVKTAVGKLVSIVSQSFTAGLVTAPQASAMTSWLEHDNGRLQQLATQRAAIAKQIAAAKAYAVSTASNIAGGYGLSSVMLGGTSGQLTSVKGILGNLGADLRQIRAFKTNLLKLAKMGLNKNYLSQLIAMGPAQGGALAAELAAADPGQVSQLNAAQSAITGLSGQIGKQAADEMYDTGKDAGRGFLSGLQAQQESITKLMDEIAKSMVATLKKELGIHSPSTVFYAHGVAVAQGLALGIASGAGQVTRAARGLSAAATLTGIHSGIPAGVLSPGGAQPIVIRQQATFTAKVDRGVLFEEMQEETYRYNVRNSGQVTGAWKPGMP